MSDNSLLIASIIMFTNLSKKICVFGEIVVTLQSER